MKAVKINFECPACGNILNEIYPARDLKMFKKVLMGPSGCACGRKGGFSLIDMTMTNLEEVQK